MDKIRIGAVSYLNTRPLVHGMENGLGSERIELSYAVPSVLADLMAADRLDIALMPIVELARMPELELVPGLGIVTRGPSRSVLLVSRRPLAEVASVALDPESRTSNALARVLFAEVWKMRPEFVGGTSSLDRNLKQCDAAVRIGDKALFESPPDGTRVHDLGTVWTETTGLPFVFAAWTARPGAVDREVYRILHQSRREGTKALKQIAERYTWNGARYPEIALDYLERHIHFRLGAAEIRAIGAFFRAARAIGVVDSVPEVRLALRRPWTTCDEVAARRGMVFGPKG